MSIHRNLARSFKGAFHDFVRGVFAENSVRARLLRATRARWLHGFARAGSAADRHKL
jgi:hypothetical protein